MLEAIFTQLVTKAARGDHRAMQLLLLYQLPEMEKHLFGSRTRGGLSPAAEKRIRQALLGEDFESEPASSGRKARERNCDQRTLEGQKTNSSLRTP